MCRTNAATSMRSYTATVILALLLTSCGHIRTKVTEYKDRQARQEQVERIVERTITEPQEVVKVVEKLVALPPHLTAPCPVTHNKDRSVGEYIRVATTNTPVLEDCAFRMDQIRALQPKEKAPGD